MNTDRIDYTHLDPCLAKVVSKCNVNGPRCSLILGFGIIASNIRKCSLVQSFHGFEGTFYRKTRPSRKMHADGMTNPSADWIPSSPMLLT